MVDETNASLWSYALSWLQSFLIFDLNYDSIANNLLHLEKESESNQIDVKDLNTYAILSIAKTLLNRNSVNLLDNADLIDERIELVIRLLNQLKGQSRIVANDWLQDAITYLEVKKITQLLLTYSAARGIANFEHYT